jgi:hypothetical protein
MSSRLVRRKLEAAENLAYDRRKMLPDPVPAASLRPARTLDIMRGTCRLLLDLGCSPILEWVLPNGRRADVAALDAAGDILIVEVKSCREDYEADAKWQDYLEFADRFYFAIDTDFPRELIPGETGLIVADRYGGAILREAPRFALAPARRKASLLRFARHAAERLIRTVMIET